ncbi:chaperonin 10-like protein [Coniochaeta sp. 2T2.1]|nr:chaperonin 10-like protein [Coniochaeta sp. 2T2.1]
MSPPSECKAITIQSIGHASITTVPLPRLRPEYILVRTLAVALNPTDYKAIDGAFGGTDDDLRGCRPGCDYVGVVEEVGSAVTKKFEKGDRIAGPCHGCNQGVPEDGAFAEWIVVKGDLAIKVPERLRDEEVAGLGIGVTTVGQGLYQELGLPLPTNPSPTPIPLLIHGGATATGILGIQYAKTSGCRVITTCSPSNADYLRSLGADVVIDYTAHPDAESFSARIRQEVGDDLTLAWDCVATEDSARMVVAAMSKGKGGKYRSLLGVDNKVIKGMNPKVEGGVTLAYFIFGEEFKKWGPFPKKEKDYEFGKMFWEMTRGLLESGKVEGKVNGVKLVYTL